ncbi:hypothetical protein OG21DRAFT_1483956 [Imleria badia]|nr:hypothetical protein OG21DRAFT_1483956 [Imleria badia]
MHHALQIQEILLNIFGHFRRPGWLRPTDLPALARTCRAFKEPALDVLWEKLVNPSPLAKCLPEASHYSEAKHCYVFSRSFTQIEWRFLRNYTRRIRSMLDENHRLDWESVGAFLNPPTTEPLFANLRDLHAIGFTFSIQHFLSMPFPCLTSLDVRYIAKEDAFLPNIRRLTIELREPDIAFSKFFSSYICRWQDLQTVDCRYTTLDVDAFVHLSRMPAFTTLSCTPSATFPPSGSPLFFTNLRRLSLYFEFLDSISRLLSRSRLPVITDLSVTIQSCPSKQDFSSFLDSVQTSNIGYTIQELKFDQGVGVQHGENGTHVLGFEDLQPCMAFSHLRRINLNLAWEVDLMDNDLLALASAWPHSEHLSINDEWGWNTLGGITPNGLLQLLQTCRSLGEIALAIDTRGYTEFCGSPASFGLTLSPLFSINVIDSFIEEESVPAIAALLAVIGPCPDFSFSVGLSGLSWESDHEERWYDAYERANGALGQHS